ncbi:hypothetical protein HZH66_015384 [Vespula vulgaris]|uniref:Uncharacterized protein n=1 Tax=Vespula vulgaris TaxID=7454 RepID=A0A834J0V3_VESVU|nr:hypothetical protein HZH66_015384 [Vespula vulgaris]
MGVEQRGISWYGGVTSGKAEYFARITGIAPTTGLSISRTETSAEAIWKGAHDTKLIGQQRFQDNQFSVGCLKFEKKDTIK